MQSLKILVVATSHSQMNNSNRKTGLWLEELAVPYYIFKEAGATIVLASPKGGEVPLDPRSESIIVSSSTTKKFQKDPEAISLLAHSEEIGKQHAQDFDFVFLLGGHGPLWDFIDNHELKLLLEDFNHRHKFIGAVCHGVAGLLPLVTINGEPLVKDRQLTAYSNSEELVSGATDMIPFLLESRLIALGAAYSKAENFVSHVIIDGTIVTGQNSASAKAVARRLLMSVKDSAKKFEQLVL
jgi:putative intracellular protease/amidase